MNEGHPLNNGEKHNDLPLVRRPSSAVERAAPGAKRILSGMVADTLVLLKKEKSKPLRVFIVYYEEGPRVICKRILQKQFERVTILEFERGDEAWQELSRTTPDLLITLDVMPGMPGEEIVRRLADKKAMCPIIVLSGWGNMSEGWVRDFSNRGLNVSLLQIPFNQLTFLKAVETALNNQRITVEKSVEIAPQPRKSRPLRIIMVCSEPAPLKSLEVLIRLWFKDAAFRLFQDNGEAAWEELSQTTPDLLITADAMPVLRGKEIVQRLLDRKAAYPIIVISALNATEEWVREYAIRGLNVTFLAMPWTVEDIRKILETSLKISLNKSPIK